MKKIWYVDFIIDQCDDFVNELLDTYAERIGCYSNRKDAYNEFMRLKNYIKTFWWKDLKEEHECGNTISIALYVGKVDDEFDEDKDNFYEASSDNYYILEERYLCGRW